MTIDALKATHINAFSAPGVPDFEPHAWWRVGPAALQPEFLAERAESMQALLQALVRALDVSVLAQRGPSPLLALLSDCDDETSPPRSYGSAATPADMSSIYSSSNPQVPAHVLTKHRLGAPSASARPRAVSTV